MTIEDELGHFLVVRVFLEESFSDEDSTHHNDSSCFFISDDQVFLLIGALNSKLKSGRFIIFDFVVCYSMIVACKGSLLDLDLNKWKPY